MKQKLLFLMTLLVLCVTGVSATNTTLKAGYTLPDLPTSVFDVSAASVDLDLNGYAVFSPAQTVIRQANPALPWFSQNSGGSTKATWTASAPFPANTNNTDNLVVAVQKTSKTYAFRFTGANEVVAYVKGNSSSRYVYLDVYEVSGGKIQTTSVGSDNTNNTAKVVKVDGLSTSKEYVAYISASSNDNGQFYGIAFKTHVTVHDITLNTNGGSEDGSAKVIEGKTKLQSISAPTYAGKSLMGYYQEAECTNLIADASGNLQVSTAYTDANARWTSASDQTLYAKWADLFAITTGTPDHGAIAADVDEAAEGATITLTATPDLRYKLDTWSITKTSDGTDAGVSVTNNQFTMPAFAVTVNATFIADSRKQILYVTSDGTVNANDKLYSALSEDYGITKAGNGDSKTVTDYDLVVLHESIGGSSATTGLVKASIEANVPVLNTKSYFYSSGRLDWGTPNAGESVTGATLNTAYTNIASHPIFNEVTISEGFVTLFSSAKAKAMQPLGSLVDGKEGYTLAITPNEGTGNGTAIHELTPAQRGVASAKYLMISIGNENGCFEILTDNGQKLLKNAAAYLMSATQFVPTYVTTTVTTNAGKWASFTPSWNATLASGAKAYIITDVDETTVTATAVTKLKAGEGYFVKGEAASTGYTATATDVNADDVTGNLIVGQLSAATISASEPDTNTKFVLGTKAGVSGLYKVTSTVNIAAGKAYLNAQKTVAANSLSFDFDGETTGIQQVEAQKELLEGDFYNLAGQRVAQPTKGLYIINGKKVIIK